MLFFQWAGVGFVFFMMAAETPTAAFAQCPNASGTAVTRSAATRTNGSSFGQQRAVAPSTGGFNPLAALQLAAQTQQIMQLRRSMGSVQPGLQPTQLPAAIPQPACNRASIAAQRRSQERADRPPTKKELLIAKLKAREAKRKAAREARLAKR